MTIRARTVNDYSTDIRFLWFHTLRGSALETAKFVLFLVVAAMSMSALKMHEKFFWLYLPLLALLLALFVALVFYRFRSKNGFGNMVVEFEFGPEDFSIHSTKENLNSTAMVRYETLHKVYETRGFIYLYPNREWAYIVDKAKIEGGTPDELTRLISGALPKGKYVVCASWR